MCDHEIGEAIDVDEPVAFGQFKGEWVGHYFRCKNTLVRETISKKSLDITLPDGQWEILLFEIDGYQEILSLGRFNRYGDD